MSQSSLKNSCLSDRGLLTTASIFLISMTLSGCGTTVPAMDLYHADTADAKANSSALVNSVAAHVRCELRRAVLNTAVDLDAPWLLSWSAKVSLTLTADEKTNLNPAAVLTTVFPTDVKTFANKTSVMTPQNFSLGIGATGLAESTRVHIIGWFDDFADFKEKRKTLAQLRQINDKACEKDGSYPIEGDLLIEENLYSAVKAATVLGTVSQPFAKGGPLDTVQHHVTFDISYGASITPTWKFVNVTASSPGVLLSATRDRKDDLLITMGPTEITDTKRKLIGTTAQPSASVVDAHLAALIGQQVATAIHATNP